MSTNSVKTLPSLIWHSMLQGIGVAVLIGFILSFVYGFVYHYQQQRMQVQQLIELLASSASTADGANLVAKQVGTLLDNDASIQNIVFYSTDHPIDTLNQAYVDQTSNDWYNALFADTVSFNRAVVSHYGSTDNTQDNVSNQRIPILSTDSATEINSVSRAQSSDTTTLVGYINITLDVHKLRAQWLHESILIWVLTIGLGLIIIGFIFRNLLYSTRDIDELATICQLIINDSDLDQLPAIQQHYGFQEIIDIKQSYIVLFERLREARQDYADLCEFEQQLHHKDKSLEVQQHNLQSMITYELKTSLNAISGGLQLLDNQNLTYDQQDVLAIIHKGSQHLELTLEQIIQLNKIEKGQIAVNLSEFNPLQMIADLLAEFDPIAQQKGLILLSRIHHIDYTLEGDSAKIQQALTTLLDNAIEFTQQGQVTIESQLTHFNDSIRWQLKVIDTGIGINSNYIEDIFTPFFQIDSSKKRHYEGTRVGLPVVKQILQLMGASIEVTSELGVGSQFMVTIPLRNKYKGWQQTLLEGLTVVYYHTDRNDSIAKELQQLGATVLSQQYEQLVIEQIMSKKIDIIMFAEDVIFEKVLHLAGLIREHETTHRALLICWYPAHSKHDLYSAEHKLKIAGIDYCENSTQNTEELIKLLKKWTGRA